MYRVIVIYVFGALLSASLLAADCDNGKYSKDGTCVACPDGWPYSTPNANSINDCYLITGAGKSVAGVGQPEVACPENYYCPGMIPVFYDLKDRFHRIEYIKSTGTQYINTGIILGSDIDTELVFENGSIGPADNALFGARDAENHYWLNGYGNKAYIRYADYHPMAESKAPLNADVKLTLEIKHGDWILDGKTIYSNSGTFNLDRPGYLFALNGTAGPKWIHKSLKIYSFAQWRNDEKIINLIPVYDSVKDECGMLDLVSGKFLTNISTDKFECGLLVDSKAGPGGAVSCAVSTNNVAPYSPPGADDVIDCGRVLRFSDNYNLFLRTVSRTKYSLKIKFGNSIFYGDSTDKECGRLRVEYNGKILSVCNMDVDI